MKFYEMTAKSPIISAHFPASDIYQTYIRNNSFTLMLFLHFYV